YEVYPIVNQLARRSRQRGLISLGEADAEDKLLVLAISQRQQPSPESHYRRRGSPRLRQRPDLDGTGTLRSARVPNEQATAHQEHDEHQAPQPGFVHVRPSLGHVSDGYGQSTRSVAYACFQTKQAE